MTMPIMRTRPRRGRNMSAASRNLESHPGRTVPRRPRAASVGTCYIVWRLREAHRHRRPRSEPAANRAWRGRDDIDTEWFQLQSKCFRERLHVGFRGGVVRCARDSLKRHERAHEDDAAPFAIDEAPTERVAERGHCSTVDVDHPQFFIERRIHERT